MNYNTIFQLIRLPNLIMLAFMQLLLRFALAQPLMMAEGRPMLLNTQEFILLVLSCVLIAAGGYIINDIEDVNIDRINKPEKVIVGKAISSNQAFGLYLTFTLIGVLIAFYLSYFARIQYVGTLNAVTAGMLYFYATSYKCIPLLGNLIVALLTSLSVLVVAFPEPLVLMNASLFSVFTGFAAFAFLLTLARELIKDLEDLNGDAAASCRTLVVATSPNSVRILASVLLIISLLLLVGIQLLSQQWEEMVSFIYLVLFVELPLLILAIRLLKSRNNVHYHQNSKLLKLIMFNGVCSLIVFYFSFS